LPAPFARAALAFIRGVLGFIRGVPASDRRALAFIPGALAKAREEKPFARSLHLIRRHHPLIVGEGDFNIPKSAGLTVSSVVRLQAKDALAEPVGCCAVGCRNNQHRQSCGVLEGEVLGNEFDGLFGGQCNVFRFLLKVLLEGFKFCCASVAFLNQEWDSLLQHRFSADAAALNLVWNFQNPLVQLRRSSSQFLAQVQDDVFRSESWREECRRRAARDLVLCDEWKHDLLVVVAPRILDSTDVGNATP